MDQTKNFWLDLFTWETWNQFLKPGGKVSGFRESRWPTVQRVASGDILLCYLTGISRFVGALEVVGQPFLDKSVIWHSDVFPARLPVKVLIQLTAETAVSVYDLREKLSFFQAAPIPLLGLLILGDLRIDSKKPMGRLSLMRSCKLRSTQG
jgi:hypothetical protein